MFAAVSAVGGYVFVQNRYGFCNGKALPIFIHKTDSGSALMTEMRMFSDRSGNDFACWCLLLRGGVFVCC